MELATNQKKSRRRRIVIIIALCVVAAAGIRAGFWYLQYAATHISTDDAFLDGHVHTIASKVPGTVRAINVQDNQKVNGGDLLLEIDPADYKVRMDEAASALQAEKARMGELNTRVNVVRRQFQELKYQAEAARLNFNLQKGVLKQIDADTKRAEAAVEAQEAQLKQAEVDTRRAEDLYKKEVIPKEKWEKAQTVLDVASAQLKVAKEQLLQVQANRETQLDRLKQAEIDILKTEAALETHKEVIHQAEAALPSQEALVSQRKSLMHGAELNRSYTRLYAPTAGYVTKKSVEVGNQIQPGQALMAIVQLEDTWIVANYKETQLKKVKPGQKVRIKVDTYPDKVFQGRVASIMAGTGSAFSLFPSENATGNYVKLVQRIPVKILLEKGEDPERILRVGMSVEPTILVE